MKISLMDDTAYVLNSHDVKEYPTHKVTLELDDSDIGVEIGDVLGDCYIKFDGKITIEFEIFPEGGIP